MRYYSILFLSLLLLWSCEWTPDEISVQAETSFSRLNIAVGDTAEVSIEGYDFMPLSGIDTSIAQVVESNSVDSAFFQFIGKSAGQLDLSTTYRLSPSAGESDQTAIHHLKLSVSDGIPVMINVGETFKLDLSDYFDASLIDQIDSLSFTCDDMCALPIVNYEADVLNTSISLTGNQPGSHLFQLLLFDVHGIQLAPLLLDCDVSIAKVVLGELFTNSGCVNCPQANEYLDAIYPDRASDFALVRYHVSWTDPRDPMNLYNPQEVRDRVIYYGIFAAPSLMLDGSLIGSLDENDWRTRIELAASVNASVYISPVDVEESTDSLFLGYDLNSFDIDPGELITWALVLEDSIHYEASNGEEHHRQVMRDMASQEASDVESGTEIAVSLKKPDNYGTGVPMSLLVFVQDPSTKAVLQARKQVIF